MAKIVIIGAGLTGISAAYHLEKKGYNNYKIFEKEPTIGGLCRSVQQDGFTFDYTGHLLHVNDPYFQELIHKTVGFEHLATIERRSFIYSHGQYTRYPFQINLHGLPDDVIVECIEGFVNGRTQRKRVVSFYDWVMRYFGPGLGNHFFFPFERKKMAYDLKKLTHTWTGRFVPSTSLQEMIRGAIRDQQDSSIGYNSQFFYPKKGGIQFWIDKLAAQLQNPIHTSCQVDAIDTRSKEVVFSNGHVEPYDQLINTMPLDIFLQKLIEKPALSVAKAARKLACNSVVNFNLGIARQDLTDKHWIYFPEQEFPFYRMGFYHNFSAELVPPGCSSLYGEFSYYQMNATRQQQLLQKSLQATKKLLKLSNDEIITQKIMHISHAYVIYDFWREKNIDALHTTLNKESIYSIGRYGQWKYSSMQESVLDGKKITDMLTIIPARQSFIAAQMPEQQPTVTS